MNMKDTTKAKIFIGLSDFRYFNCLARKDGKQEALAEVAGTLK